MAGIAVQIEMVPDTLTVLQHWKSPELSVWLVTVMREAHEAEGRDRAPETNHGSEQLREIYLLSQRLRTRTRQSTKTPAPLLHANRVED